ncbi:apolipoprotein D-like [Ischnura elegans]|uniref:apolipoprotein D-like n=1 Tax=Ischnura elegans TaxID=197161 RepID=UPI001ED89080|nr:apolipoprotein D-like [Ischnura elegans]
MLLFVSLVLFAVANAQIPGFTGCPAYQAMENFDMEKFAGRWYESQRYFQVLEVGTRCVATVYKIKPDGKVGVANEMVTRITGIRRVLEGELKNVGKSGEAKLSVKYTNLPVSFDTQYSILDTDYDNYAIAWSCNSLGPFSSTHAWVMTRKRDPTEAVLQRAYGVLDKIGLSRNFFVRSDQSECEDPVQELPEVAAAGPAKKPLDTFTASAQESVAPIAAQVHHAAGTNDAAPAPAPSRATVPARPYAAAVPPPIPVVAAAQAAAVPAPVADEVVHQAPVAHVAVPVENSGKN